ncbi:hypothetical protein P262_02525 [Cronobacter malonaticus]|uniref:Uncharacterized protein n=1 Tax=Cronobacter malonaticus TaxID=413503 RepID=V5TY17_9ENTR|nr:hypothetical protein P262_02525 [Cronobacter malonaticus]
MSELKNPPYGGFFLPAIKQSCQYPAAFYRSMTYEYRLFPLSAVVVTIKKFLTYSLAYSATLTCS